MTGEALAGLAPALPNVGDVLPAWQAGLETPRLYLRPPTRDCLPGWQTLHSDPSVTRYLDAEPLSPDESWRDLAFVMGHAQLTGFSMWSVYTKADGAFIGRVGPWMPLGWPALEVAWALLPSAQGQGYAYEAAGAALQWCAAHIPGAAAVIHSLRPGNAPSTALVERLNARILGEADIGNVRHTIWVSALETWR